MEQNKQAGRIQEIKNELERIDHLRCELVSELAQLSGSDSQQRSGSEYRGTPAADKTPQTVDEKIQLFIRLFRCRDDVYPRFWHNPKSGKSGYSPACSHEWRQGICQKPRVKCGNCANAAFIPFDSRVVQQHLLGEIAIGSYAINHQDHCTFLAADFDKATWKNDCTAFREAAAVMGIQAAIEVSKSGNGAHAWIFFHGFVPAKKARLLGDVILGRAMDSQNRLQLESYDRFFPNQDYIPNGGFGNLIALPLQKRYRQNGCSVFIDGQLNIFSNQWEYLAGIHRLSLEDVDLLVSEYSSYSTLVPPGKSRRASEPVDDLSVAESVVGLYRDSRHEKVNDSISVTLGGQIEIPLISLPAHVLQGLKRLAVIANPKFFEAQRMRFSTWNIPKYIFCGGNDADNLFLPRGPV